MNRWLDVDALMRAWAAGVAVLYGTLIVVIVLFLTSSPLRAAAMLLPFLVAAVVFALSLLKIRFDDRSRFPRAASWCVLLVGCYPLVSFAFVLGPLLLTAAPAAFTAPRLRIEP